MNDLKSESVHDVFCIIGFTLQGIMKCKYIVSAQQSSQSRCDTAMSRCCVQLFLLNVFFQLLDISCSMLLLHILKCGVQKLHYISNCVLNI